MAKSADTWLLPGCSHDAPYGYTATGKKRLKPTKAQGIRLAEVGLTTKEYGGTDVKPRAGLSGERLTASQKALEDARKRRERIRKQKIALLEREHGPDWKEKGIKLSSVTPQEAIEGVLHYAEEDEDEELAAEARDLAATAAKVARQRSRPVVARATPSWSIDHKKALDSLSENSTKTAAMLEALAGRLEAVEAAAADVSGIVRKNSLERQEAREAARRLREARKAKKEPERVPRSEPAPEPASEPASEPEREARSLESKPAGPVSWGDLGF